MSQPFILALDISKSCTGIAFGYAGETPRFLSIRGGDMDDEAAMCRLGTWLIDFTKLNHIDRLFYEAAISPAAFMGRYDEDAGKVRMTTNPGTTITLAKMAGVVEFVAGMKRIPHDPAHVQTVRKAFLGHARPENPKKAAKLMCEHMGWAPANMDEADAGAVWYWGVTKASPRHAPPLLPWDQQRIRDEAAASARQIAGGRRG